MKLHQFLWLVIGTVLVGFARAGGPQLEQLKKALQNPKDAVRVDAIKNFKFSDADASKVAEILVPALSDKSPQVQQAASATLVRIGAGAVPALAKGLNSNDVKPRRDCLIVLEQLGPKSKPAAPALAKLLVGLDDGLRQKAQGVLVQIGPDAAAPVTELLGKVEHRKHWPTLANVLERIEGQGRPTASFVPTVAKHLEHGDPQVRQAALTMLHKLGPRAKDAAPAVARLIADPDGNLRGMSSNLLLTFGSDAIPALKMQLKQPSAEVRLGATQTLGRFGNHKKDVAHALVPLLKDKDLRVKLAVLGILSQMRSPELAGPVGEALRDSDPQVRRASAQYLQQAPKEARPALPALVHALRDSDAQVRSQAGNILRTFGPEAIPALSASKNNDPIEAQLLTVSIMASFGKAGKDAIPFLTDRARSDNVPLRTAALDGLAKILPESLPSLKTLLADKNPALRVATISALAKAGPGAKESVDILVPTLTDSDESVRKAAISAVTRIGPAAIPALTGLTENKNAEVRVAALNVLTQLGPADKATLSSLRKLMKDPQPEVRAAAIRWLVRSIPPGPEAKEFMEPLAPVLSDKDWHTRRSASLALGKAGAIAVDALIALVENSDNPTARAEAILALGTIGPGAKGAIKPLIEVLRDPTQGHLHIQVMASLAKMNPDAGVALVGLLNDRDTNVRVLAINALAPEQARTAKDTLVKMLRDPSDEIRWASAKALTRLGVFADVEPLLNDPKAEVRTAAVWAVGSIATPVVLSKALRDDEPSVRRAAAMALAKRGSDAYPVLTEALRSKNFRGETGAANAMALMVDRADDLIPVLVETLLTKECQAPDALAKTILVVNPILGARELSSKTQVADLLRLTKKAGILEEEIAEVQELACRALAERGAGATEALPRLREMIKNPKTELNALAAAARALHAIAPKESAYLLAPDLVSRLVLATHAKSKSLREDGMNDLMQVGLKSETFEAILAMLSTNLGTEEPNAWIIHHADATQSWNLAGPNMVRVLALFHGRSKLGPRRLTPAAEEALKAHLWRYVQQPVGKGIQPRPLAEVGAILPIDQLPWLTSAYLALEILKDDPEYKDRKVLGRTPLDLYQEWTVWWREWAKNRAMNGLWSEMGLNSHQAFIWPNLLNMVDLAGDPTVKQRFQMLLDLTMIEEEQISLQGVRAGRRGKKNEVGSNLDPWRDLLFGETPRLFSDANINYRGIYLTTTYKLPTAAILLRKLNRPDSHYAITNRHFHGGAVFAFATPHYALGCQFSQAKGTSEFPGAWHRLIFDDMNAVLFPLMDGGRHHVQHKSVYLARIAGVELPVAEFTAALKVVERGGWIFLSNGPAYAGIHVTGGYQLSRSGRKDMGRQHCDSVTAKAAQSFVVLQAGDVSSFGSFEKFQDAILKAPLRVTDTSIHFTGPNAPAIELFRDAARATTIDGIPQLLRSPTKCYDSPYLQGDVGQSRITVRFGPFSAVYDFDKNTVVESSLK